MSGARDLYEADPRSCAPTRSSEALDDASAELFRRLAATQREGGRETDEREGKRSRFGNRHR